VLDIVAFLVYTELTVRKDSKMNYILVVYNFKKVEVFRKVYKNVSGTFMHEIYKDYAYKGGKGGYADFFPSK
jgi:hypothetical protein